MKKEVKVTDPVEVMIASQLSQFEVKEEDLKQKVAQYSLLVVTGVDDKAGRKAVSEARKDLKFIRTGVTGTGKDLRENFTKVTKAIIAREKELIAITQPEEDRLAQIEKDIAEEEEELERIRLHEEQERIISRTKELESYGATFNGVQYELGDNIITMSEVRLFTETEFTRKMVFFQEDYENFEQLKLQAEIERQNGFKERYNNAYNFLIENGYAEDEFGVNSLEYYHFIGKNHYAELESDEELESFKNHITTTREKYLKEKADAEAKRIADEKLKAEQDRLAEIDRQQKEKQAELDRKQKELDDQLAAVQKQKEADEKRAKQLEYDAKVNLFESRRMQLMNTPNILAKIDIDNMYCSMYTLSDELWGYFLHDCKSEFDARQERLAKEAEEKAAAEEKRRIEMMPDIELLKQIAVDIKGTIVDHNMKTEEGKKVLASINDLKSKTVKYIEDQIKNI